MEKENIIDKEEKEVDFKAPIPTLVMQMKDLKLGVSVEWDSLLRTTMEFKKKKPSWLKSNQIIYQPKGQNFGAHYINDAPYRVIAAPQLFVIDVNDSQCRPEFLCWQLNQSPIRKRFERIHKGSIQISIRAKELAEIEVAIPDIENRKQLKNSIVKS